MPLLAALDYCTVMPPKPWVPTPVTVLFKLQNTNSGMLVSLDQASHANSARTHHHSDTGARDRLWQFIRVSGGYFKIRNPETGFVAGVQAKSRSNSTPLVQVQDTGGE